MTEKDTIAIPLPLLMLEMIGAVLVALGLAKTIGGIDIIPASWQFNKYGVIFLLVGVMLMVPFNIHMLQKILDRVARARAKGRGPE